MKYTRNLRMYVGSHDGIYSMTRMGDGVGWQKSPVKKLDHAAARFAPSASLQGRTYAAAYESGVWRTDDGGQT